MNQAIIRLPEVKKRTGLSRSSIYLRVSRGEFPRPVALGARAVGWKEEAILEWVEGLTTKGIAKSSRTTTITENN